MNIVGDAHIRPLPIDNAIDTAIQIAAGLAKAHAKGIIHRDIKPANILITEDGVVKIVDFGLAKLAGRTMLTKEGTTLGTASYMSPEQTQGAAVDHRTDIWALGVVLYEMVTGKQPFEGDYDQAVMYSIMNEDPEPITGLRTGLPMELERIKKLYPEDKELIFFIGDWSYHNVQFETAREYLERVLILDPVGVKNSIQDENSLKSCLKIDNV